MQEAPNQNAKHNCTACVVISAKNEVGSIGRCVEEAKGFTNKIVVMDGHSTDGTREAAEAAGATVMLDSGLGKGSAIRMAIETLSEEVLVFMDADGSHNPADIPRLVAPVAAHEVALCIGSRFAGGSDELSVTLPQLIRTIGNISMNIAINRRWNVRLTDTLNGFRAVNREVAKSIGLVENRHTIEQEMVMKILRHGYRVKNVPTHEYDREYGKSHINIWREWPLFVWCVVRNLLFHDPPRGYSRLGGW